MPAGSTIGGSETVQLIRAVTRQSHWACLSVVMVSSPGFPGPGVPSRGAEGPSSWLPLKRERPEAVRRYSHPISAFCARAPDRSDRAHRRLETEGASSRGRRERPRESPTPARRGPPTRVRGAAPPCPRRARSRRAAAAPDLQGRACPGRRRRSNAPRGGRFRHRGIEWSCAFRGSRFKRASLSNPSRNVLCSAK